MKGIESPGRMAAAVGISAVVTAGFGWPEVLLGWCAALILTWAIGPLTEREMQGSWRRGLLLLSGMLLAAAAVTIAEEAFPQDSTFPFVSLGAILLFYRALLGTEWGNRGAANVMGMLVLVMLLAAEVAGAGNMHWAYLRPRGFRWKAVLTTAAIGALFLGTGGRERSWKLGTAFLCVGMSLVTRGILGPYLTEQLEIPMYRAMENIRVFGVSQRMEAFLASAILMGAFAGMLCGASLIRKSGFFTENRKCGKWGNAAVALAIFLLEWWCRWAGTGMRMWMKTVFWGIFVVAALIVVIFEKNEKRG